LVELGINVTKEDLLHPENSRDTIRKMFEFLVEICLGIPRDELAQPAFSGLQTLTYPELHEESIPHLNFLRAVLRMMDICEIHDFSLRDLSAPSSARLNKQLSGIINFVKFREEKLLLLADLSTTREDSLHRLAQSREKHETGSTRLALLREQTRDEATTLAGLEHDCQALSETVASLQREDQALENELLQVQDDNTSLEEQIASALAQADDLVAVQRRLAAQVVTSPEKFRKQILEVGQALQHEQRDAKAAEKRVKELHTWQAHIDEAHAETALALEQIEEVRAEVERQKTLIAELDAHKQSLAAQREGVQAGVQAVQQLQRASQRAEERLSALRKQAAGRAEEAQGAMDTLHNQLLEAEAFRLQVKATVERAEGERMRSERELEAEASMQEQEIAEIKTGFQSLEKKVVSHLQALRKALEAQRRAPVHVA
jgi:kinetochore protein Nuf2